MGKFYGGGTVFPLEPFGQELPGASPATIPIIRDSLVPQPEGLPVGGAVPSSPAGFAPYMIQPEVIGSIPERGIVPALWGGGTQASFLDKGIFSQPLSMTPSGVTGARPLDPPAPVFPFFTTSASNAANVAASTDLRAAITAQRTLEAQRKADALAYAAKKALEKAYVDSDPSTQGDAKAKHEAAAQAQREADRLAQKTAQADQDAADAARKAQIAADREAAAQAARDAANAEAVARGDEKAYEEWGSVPPSVPPEMFAYPGLVAGYSPPGYAAPMGGGAAAGFLLGGPIGALVGALLGGGYVYAKRRAAAPVSAQTTHAPFVPPGGGGSAWDPNNPDTWKFQ